jgi:predicted PurR-regulated permease PerM
MTVTRSATMRVRRNGTRGRIQRGDIRSGLPRSLVLAAAWSWRLLLVGIVAYAVVRILALLSLVVIPLVAALLLAALLRPVAELLQHRRLPGPLSALLTLLLAVVVLGGLGYLIGVLFAQQLPSLIQQLVGTVHQLREDFAGYQLVKSSSIRSRRPRSTGCSETAARPSAI